MKLLVVVVESMRFASGGVFQYLVANPYSIITWNVLTTLQPTALRES